MSIAEMLKNYRIHKNYTFRRLANEIGVDAASIFHWENGSYMPSFDNIIKLSEVLEIDLKELTLAYMNEKIKRKAN